MRRTLIPAVATAVLASGGVALATGPQSGKTRAAASSGGHTIKVFTATAQFQYVDAAPAGFSLGDQNIFSDNVFRNRNGPRVGLDGGVCTVVRVADAKSFTGTLQCQVSYSLSGGLITAQELFPIAHLQYSGTHTAAITGGTGRFRDARGQVTVEFLSSGRGANVTFSIG